MGVCGGCGQAQCIPLPGQPALNAYYATEYRKGGRYGADAADTTAFPRDNLFFFNRGLSVATLLREKGGVPNRPLRVLDVGAGYGHILELIRQTFPGSEVTAHELSEPCVAHLESRGMHV